MPQSRRWSPTARGRVRPPANAIAAAECVWESHRLFFELAACDRTCEYRACGQSRTSCRYCDALDLNEERPSRSQICTHLQKYVIESHWMVDGWCMADCGSFGRFGCL